jgi:hypothetical protein
MNNFHSIFSWLRTNHPIFAKMESLENCPTPIILEDDEGIDEESEDATVENNIGFQIMEILLVQIQFFIPNLIWLMLC